MYLHGRTKDLSPILIIDIKNLAGLLERKELDPESFCMLHNFLSNYMTLNMLTPGQVEKWIVIFNLNQYPVSQLPISMFTAVNKELSHNFIETNRKAFVTNATWFQTMAIRFL